MLWPYTAGIDAAASFKLGTRAEALFEAVKKRGPASDAGEEEDFPLNPVHR
jgi:hypothetical protein